MKKLTAKDFVSEQINSHRGELEPGEQVTIEYGGFAVNTIRRAIRDNGFRSTIDDCGNMFALCVAE